MGTKCDLKWPRMTFFFRFQAAMSCRNLVNTIHLLTKSSMVRPSCSTEPDLSHGAHENEHLEPKKHNSPVWHDVPVSPTTEHLITISLSFSQLRCFDSNFVAKTLSCLKPFSQRGPRSIGKPAGESARLHKDLLHLACQQWEYPATWQTSLSK